MDAKRLACIHKELQNLVQPQTYKLGLNLYLESFTGQELHDKLLSHDLVGGTAEADIACTLMLRRGWLQHVEAAANIASTPFDVENLYRFGTSPAQDDLVVAGSAPSLGVPEPVDGEGYVEVDQDAAESQKRRLSAQRGVDLFLSGLNTPTPPADANSNMGGVGVGSQERRLAGHTRSATLPAEMTHHLPTTDTTPVGSAFWTPQEDVALGEAVAKYGEEWGFVAHSVRTKNELQCEMRWLEKLRDAKLTQTARRHKESRLGLRSRKANKDKKVFRELFEESQRGALTAEYLARKDQMQLERQNKLGTPESVLRRRARSTDSADNAAVGGAAGPCAVPGARTGDEVAWAAAPGGSTRFVDARYSPRWNSLRLNATERKLLASAVEAPAHTKQAPGPRDGLPDPSERLNLPLIVMGLSNPPESSRGLRETHYIVKIYIDKTSRHASTNPMVRKGDHGITWGELLVLEDVSSETMLDIRLLVRHRLIGNEEIGRTEITVSELVRRPFRNLVIHNSASRVVTDANENNVTLLKIGVDKSTLPKSWPMPMNEPYAARGYPKHIMIITRGTRGDVQPFLALARELANRYNWMVTICSEFRYKDYIKKNALGLERGCIRFRISGGDTQKRVDSRISKWAINLPSSTMQHIMLAFSEREFFDSEPSLYYWAKTMKPDYLMFGFTLAAIAMIISESLRIPLIGFILQPTCLPSSQYPPLVPLDEHSYQRMTEKTRRRDRKHSEFSSMKALLENNPITGHLNSMRAKRGLRPIRRFTGKASIVQAIQSSTWTDLQVQGIPLVVPISTLAFGGKPPDWGPKSVLTNYIFLRGKTVPPLDPKHIDFIEQARNQGRKLIVLAFSSMPVERLDILRIAIKIIAHCEKEVSIFALIGDHVGDPGSDSDVEGAAAAYTAKGRLLVDKGAPFGRLFPLMDAIVAHGGLGTTGEAIMASVPVIITGVLLFDQRFWGSRCHDLGIGPFPVHVSKFKTQCVSLIDKALADDSEWPVNAKQVGREIEESMANDPSGVIVNAETVYRMVQEAPIFSYESAPPGSSAGALGSGSAMAVAGSDDDNDDDADTIIEEEDEAADGVAALGHGAVSSRQHSSRLRGLLGLQ